MGSERPETPPDSGWSDPPARTDRDASGWSDPPPGTDLDAPAVGAGDEPPRDPTPAPAPKQRPAREPLKKAKRGLVKLIATAGIVGIDVALGAILVSQDVAGWTTGLVTGIVAVVLTAIVWSPRPR